MTFFNQYVFKCYFRQLNEFQTKKLFERAHLKFQVSSFELRDFLRNFFSSYRNCSRTFQVKDINEQSTVRYTSGIVRWSTIDHLDLRQTVGFERLSRGRFPFFIRFCRYLRHHFSEIHRPLEIQKVIRWFPPRLKSVQPLRQIVRQVHYLVQSRLTAKKQGHWCERLVPDDIRLPIWRTTNRG